jgi:hypothetical protein
MRKKVEEEDHCKDTHKLFVDGKVYELYMKNFENCSTNLEIWNEIKQQFPVGQQGKEEQESKWKLLTLFITKLKHKSLKKLINRVQEFRHEMEEAEEMMNDGKTTMVSFDPSMSTKVPDHYSGNGIFNQRNSAYSKAGSASSDKSKFRSRDEPLTAVKFEMPSA